MYREERSNNKAVNWGAGPTETSKDVLSQNCFAFTRQDGQVFRNAQGVAGGSNPGIPLRGQKTVMHDPLELQDARRHTK
jgi:hypothetical protein